MIFYVFKQRKIKSISVFRRQKTKPMGVTIHYRGRLRKAADIQPLVGELEDVCRSAGWKFNLLDFPDPESSDEPFSGITFQPHPKCETVWMCFNQKGELYHPFTYQPDDGSLPWSFTKTQFAGAATHMAICDLFRYLEEKYFDLLEVKDEARYWETGDVNFLQEQFSYLEDAINFLEDGLNALPEGEKSLQKIKEIAEQFRQRRKPPGYSG